MEMCSDLLFLGKYQLLPVNKPTLKKLLEIAMCTVLMLIHDGYYRQRDGSAIGSPPAPPLANGWLKNEKHPVLKEEKIMIETLQTLRSEGEISEELFDEIKPRGESACSFVWFG